MSPILLQIWGEMKNSLFLRVHFCKFFLRGDSIMIYSGWKDIWQEWMRGNHFKKVTLPPDHITYTTTLAFRSFLKTLWPYHYPCQTTLPRVQGYVTGEKMDAEEPFQESQWTFLGNQHCNCQFRVLHIFSSKHIYSFWDGVSELWSEFI